MSFNYVNQYISNNDIVFLHEQINNFKFQTFNQPQRLNFPYYQIHGGFDLRFRNQYFSVINSNKELYYLVLYFSEDMMLDKKKMLEFPINNRMKNKNITDFMISKYYNLGTNPGDLAGFIDFFQAKSFLDISSNYGSGAIASYCKNIEYLGFNCHSNLLNISPNCIESEFNISYIQHKYDLVFWDLDLEFNNDVNYELVNIIFPRFEQLKNLGNRFMIQCTDIDKIVTECVLFFLSTHLNLTYEGCIKIENNIYWFFIDEIELTNYKHHFSEYFPEIWMMYDSQNNNKWKPNSEKEKAVYDVCQIDPNNYDSDEFNSILSCFNEKIDLIITPEDFHYHGKLKNLIKKLNNMPENKVLDISDIESDLTGCKVVDRPSGTKINKKIKILCNQLPLVTNNVQAYFTLIKHLPNYQIYQQDINLITKIFTQK